MTNETYNGWTNHATWKINLEWFDGYDLCDTFGAEEWQEFISEWFEEARASIESDANPERIALWFEITAEAWIADYIRDYPEGHLSMECETTRELAMCFLNLVNWREIAKHKLANDTAYLEALEKIKAGEFVEEGEA